MAASLLVCQFFKKDLIPIFCVNLNACVYVCVLCVLVPTKARRGCQILVTGVTEGCELPVCMLETELRLATRAASAHISQFLIYKLFISVTLGRAGKYAITRCIPSLRLFLNKKNQNPKTCYCLVSFFRLGFTLQLPYLLMRQIPFVVAEGLLKSMKQAEG